MAKRGKYIQSKVLEAVYEELDKQNLSKGDCLEFLKSHTTIKESRIKSILDEKNKRTITIQEIDNIASALNVDTAHLFRNVDTGINKR